MITRDNYEIVFIDYIDGNLSTSDKQELKIFLAENTDLQDELNSLSSIKLNATGIAYPKKETLYKSDLDDEDYFNELSLKAIANEITTDEADRLMRYLELRPEKCRDFEIFKLVKCIPIPTIEFPNKETLYRKKAFIYFNRYLAIAASLALLIGITFLFKYNSTTPQQIITKVTIQSNTKENIETPVTSSIDKTFQKKEEKSKGSYQIPDHKAQKIKPVKRRTKNTIKLAKMIPLTIQLSDDKQKVSISYLAPYKAPTTAEKNSNPIKEYYKLRNQLSNINLASTIEKIHFQDKVLSTLNALSNNKIQFIKDTNGKIRKLNFNSDLIAFTIPFE